MPKVKLSDIKSGTCWKVKFSQHEVFVFLVTKIIKIRSGEGAFDAHGIQGNGIARVLQWIDKSDLPNFSPAKLTATQRKICERAMGI